MLLTPLPDYLNGGTLLAMPDVGGATGDPIADPLTGPESALPPPTLSTFEAAFRFVLTEEGADTNDPNDPGGLTRYGIAQNKHPDVNVSQLTLAQAKAIYRTSYWQPIHAQELPPAVALALFDAAVNVGPAKAVSMLQKALGVEIDGVVGSRTLKAAGRQGTEVLPRFLANRAAYYLELAEFKPRFRVYLNGWLARCFRVHASALELA